MSLHTFKRLPANEIKLSEADLTDENPIKPLQILKTGTFYDPRYKKFSITEKMLDEMIKNFDDGVRNLVPNLDFRHEGDGPAAGWAKKLYKKSEGDSVQLWGDFELTPIGKKSLSQKEYGYTSAEFDENYICNETGKKHGCVFKGLALTNRPVIKTMASTIQLSEVSEEIQKEKSKMDEEMKKTLADKDAKIKELQDQLESMKKEVEEKKLSEQEQVKKLKEENETLKKENEFSKLLSEGKAVPAQKEAFMKNDMIQFASLAGKVKLAEQGHGGTPSDEESDDVEALILEKAKKLSEEKKITTSQAIAEILKSDKKLAEKRAALFE